MAADAQNSVSASLNEQLTAPPGWTKKLVPAKAKYITLRKHDVVFIAPDGQEIPSVWHLRRYLKAHPEGPAFSEFIWSSGEESVRRSARASTRKATSVTEKRIIKRKAKRNAAEMDAEGEEEEEDKVELPARKRVKKTGKSADSAGESAVKDQAIPGEDEVMHEAAEEAIDIGKLDVQDVAPVNDEAEAGKADVQHAAPVTDEAEKGKVLDDATDEQVEAEKNSSVNATNGVMHEESKVEAVKLQVAEVEEQTVEVKEQNVEVKEQVIVVKEQVEEVITTDITELQEEVEAKGETPLVAPSDDQKGEEAIMNSDKPLEVADESVVESKESLDQTVIEVREEVHTVATETCAIEQRQEGEKKMSLEPLMQKEEQERLPSVHNSPLQVDHIKERSPNELSSSPLPVNVANQ